MNQRQQLWLRIALGTLVVVIFAPSISAGLVWDDRYLLADNPALDDLGLLLSSDLFSTTSAGKSDVYRPLVMLTYWLGHQIGWGAVGGHVLNILIHCLVFWGLLKLLDGWQRHGLLNSVLAFAAVVHPATTEAVCWLSGRQDLLPIALLIGAYLAFQRQRMWAMLLCLGLTVFCKENYLLVPGVLVLWMLGAGRLQAGWILALLAAPLSYVGLRQVLDLPLKSAALNGDAIDGLGAVGLRFAELLVVPDSAHSTPLFAPQPLLGWVLLLFVAALVVLSWRRPVVAFASSFFLLVLPLGAVVLQTGLIGDRYTYGTVMAMVLCLQPVLIKVLQHPPFSGWMRKLPLALLGVVLVWGLSSWNRAAAWQSDRQLFETDVAVQPDNPHAAFHLASVYHREDQDCARAIPLYQLARAVELRASTNLLACLYDTNAYAPAVQLGEELLLQHPEHAKILANTARAHFSLGQLARSEELILRSLKLANQNPNSWLLLGSIYGNQGRYEKAQRSFQTVLELEPSSVSAQQSLQKVENLLQQP